MHKQFYTLRFFFISLLLSAGFNYAVHAQTINLSMYNSSTGGDGTTAFKGDVMIYTIIITNTTASNMTNSTVTGIIPPGTTYYPGSTKLNGVSVPDISGKMPFAGAGGLVNSTSSGAGIVAPNASATVEFWVSVNAYTGSFNDYAILQTTTSSGTVAIKSTTPTTSLPIQNCPQMFQSTAIIGTQGGTSTYPYKIIKLLNTTNGTGGTNVFTYGSTACYDALSGAQLAAGSVLTDAEAMAYDPNSYRIYFINGTSNSPTQDLCYIDQYYGGTTYSPAGLRYVGYPLETNTGAGYNINRMTWSNGFGYALTANAQDLIRFSADPSTNAPIITRLGALINDANNGSNDVLSETGGDIFADGSGKLYLIPVSGKMYRINPDTRIATYTGAITGLPSTGTNSAGADASGYIYIGGAYQNVFRVDPSTMVAAAINSGTANVWKNGGYTSCTSPIMAPTLNATKTFTDITTGSTSSVMGGDIVEYTITVSNTGNGSAVVAKLCDAIPTYAHYIVNSTTMNGVAVADIGGLMPFSVTGGQLINSSNEPAGIVKPGNANNVVIKFRVTTDQYKTVCNQSTITFSDADGNTIYVMSNDPSQSGFQAPTCFPSNGPPRKAVNGTASPVTEQLQPVISAQVRPNPFNEEINLQVQLNTAEQVRVRLTDFYGRTVYTSTQQVAAGYNSLHIDVPAGLASGVYVLELSAGNNRLMQKKLIKQ
jgi:uncharacterized repeat protein (TIGR01451 family)